jgi:hypothetical protein
VTSATLNNTLNWVWLGVAACALLWLAYQELRRRGDRRRWAGPRRLVAVLLASFAIFPAISNSDDLLSYSLLNAQLGRHGGYGSPIPEDPAESARVQLARLLETLDHCQTALICTFAVVLFSLSFAFVFRPEIHAYCLVSRSGRSPPAL